MFSEFLWPVWEGDTVPSRKAGGSQEPWELAGCALMVARMLRHLAPKDNSRLWDS